MSACEKVASEQLKGRRYRVVSVGDDTLFRLGISEEIMKWHACGIKLHAKMYGNFEGGCLKNCALFWVGVAE